jgi:hypothetical protein
MPTKGTAIPLLMAQKAVGGGKNAVSRDACVSKIDTIQNDSAAQSLKWPILLLGF